MDLEARPFDSLIGRTDRILSELIVTAKEGLDKPDTKTLEHHAEDMIGAGIQLLKLINSKVPQFLVTRIEEVNKCSFTISYKDTVEQPAQVDLKIPDKSTLIDDEVPF
jgi:hypothetical protein